MGKDRWCHPPNFFTYFADSSKPTRTDYRGKVWAIVNDTCCGKSTASKNPLGHGSIRNTDPQRRVVHSAGVALAKEATVGWHWLCQCSPWDD